ncbi:MAG: tetratricopeptide repeat protein [Verrucomicrobia bacterium]|nr:tetratricopeptide repeat protein [Verrucomicrobiota bacterium]
MKRMTRLGVGLLSLCAGALLAVAQAPDDLYVRMYNLILQADSLRASGRVQDAIERYVEARTVLDQIETSYPNWNPKIVKYRREYIAERMGPAAPSTPSPATPAPAAGTPASVGPGIKSDPESAQRMTALLEEIASLSAERDTLQVKLREALTVQPAAVDPRELSKAERRLEEALAENANLKANLAEHQAKLARAVDPNAYAEAQKALKEANDALKRQTQSVTALTKERDALQQKLQRATDKAQARAAREESRPTKADAVAYAEAQKAFKEARDSLRRQAQAMSVLTKERDSLREQLERANRRSQTRAAQDDSKLMAELKAKADDLKAKLDQAQSTLEAERGRSAILQSEKLTLENRLMTLSARPATPTPAPVAPETGGTAPTPTPAAPSPTPATAAAPIGRPASAAAPSSKAEKAAEKAWVKQLERERNDLRKRVAALSREVQDRKVRSGSAQQDRLAEELAILRARIQVYEARQVPFTPEELALFNTKAALSDRTELSASKRSARQIPAGAAALVADARRAFQRGQLTEAEQKFRQALVLDEKNVNLLTDLAATHLQQGQLEAAEAALNKVTAQEPNDPEALALLGLLRYQQARYDEALDVLSRAAQLNPDNPHTQNYLGITLGLKGQRGPAEQAFRKAIQLNPDYAEAHYNLAFIYVHQKPPFLELARWHYNKALAAGHETNPEMERLLSGTPAASSAPQNP